MNKGRLWTKDFVIVSVINFILLLIHLLLMVTIASYAIDKFHASTSMAGLTAGIIIIGALIGRLGAGRIIGDIGSKRILTIGVVFFITTSALYFGAINLPLLLINRLLHGIALGVASTATGTIVAQIIPDEKRGEGIGYYSISAILATAVGPFLGILLSQHANFKIIFIFNLILGVICFVISLIVNEPALRSCGQDEIGAGRRFNLSNFLEFKAMPISLVSLIIGFSYSGVITFMSLYSRQINLVEAASLFFLVSAMINLVSRPFSGRLFDAKGANMVVYPCLFIFASGMLLYSQAHHGITLLLASALMGLGFGNYISCSQAIAIKLTAPHRFGLAISTYFIFYDLGVGIGPFLLGFLVPFTGYRGLYLMMVFVILSGIAFYYFLHGKNVRTVLPKVGQNMSA
jgi:MFS family permease